MCHCFGYPPILLQDMFDFENTRGCLLAVSPDVSQGFTTFEYYQLLETHRLSYLCVHLIVFFARKHAFVCTINSILDTPLNSSKN